MSIETRTDVRSDLQALCLALAEGKPVDPAVSARVRERSRKVQEELSRKFGTREFAAELLRELRDE
ncbi:MAG TPA: hypothetical protein VGN57_07585 [Pirellulaceae bacterium]|jgi:hypothetical protein|nr:hypothetical protein [Pirellulaceae bacterium]